MATVAYRQIFNLPLYNDTCGILIWAKTCTEATRRGLQMAEVMALSDIMWNVKLIGKSATSIGKATDFQSDVIDSLCDFRLFAFFSRTRVCVCNAACQMTYERLAYLT